MADLTHTRGDTGVFRMAVLGVDDEANQSVVDLTGYTVFFTAKESKDDADVDAVIALDSGGSGIDVDDPTNGRFLLNISPSDTSSLVMTADEVVLVYDVQIVSGTGDVYTVGTGTLTITKDVTLRVS